MIIEVFGPSCAGKTALIHGVTQILRCDGIPIEMFSGKIEQPIRDSRGDFLQHPRDLRLRIWFAANSAVADLPSGRQFNHSLELSKRLKDSGAVQILDEGPLKWSSTVGYNRKFPTLLASGIPRPDIAILVDCEFDVRLARLRNTGRFHARARTEDELKARDHAKREWNEWLVDRLKLNVVRVDTSSGVDRSESVAQAIRSRLSGQVAAEGRRFTGGIAE